MWGPVADADEEFHITIEPVPMWGPVADDADAYPRPGRYFPPFRARGCRGACGLGWLALPGHLPHALYRQARGALHPAAATGALPGLC